MAVIGKIRNYSWLLLAFIGLALLAFILGDFVRKGQKSGPKNDLAEIAGEKVSYMDFNSEYESQLELYKQQSGGASIDKNTSDQLRERLWDELVRKIVLHKEAKELGLIVKGKEARDQIVSPEELADMTTGKEPHPYVIQFFTQGQPDKFDPRQVAQFIENFDKQEDFVKNLWLYYEKNIKEDRLSSKYFTLISKGLYVTSSEAKKSFDSRNKIVKFRLASLRYQTISDSTVKVSDEEMKNYYEKHKYEFEQEEGRSIEYVAFDVKPSKEDFKKGEEEIVKMKEEFTKDANSEAYVNANSTTKFSPLFVKKGALDKEIDSLFFSAEVGTIHGPYLLDDTYKVAKLMAREARPDSLKARHILIGFTGSRVEKATLTKEQAKAKADSLAAVLRKDTTKFADLAIKFSNDPTAKENKGSLGWFNDGAMIKKFNDVCIAGKKGDVEVVETEFGYHVINILNKTNPIVKVQVAIVDRKVDPSEATFNTIYAQASAFATECTSKEIFEKKIVEKGLNKRIADNLKETDRNLPGIESPTELVRWAYNAEKDAISPSFDVTRKYVVAHLKEIKNKGFAPMEQVKTEVELGAKRVKKGEMLVAKFNAQLAKTKDLYALAAGLNSKVDTVEGLSFAAFGVPALQAAEPAVIGTVFGLKAGQMSKPIVGKSGVVVVLVDEFKDAAPTTDMKQAQQQLQSFLRSRARSDGYNALLKKADVKDNRGKFF